jgi:hypothetical protein
MQRTHIQLGTAAAALILASGAAFGQCTDYDFENYAVGTPISSQYDGVTFSAPPGSCGGMGSVRPIIVEPDSGTSSGTKALGIEQGCPEFSPDYLRMVFDEAQRIVTFTMGEPVSPGVTFQVRAYNTGGGLIYLRTFSCGDGVFRFVRIGSEEGSPIIRRVEVESPSQFWECIDDLSFNHDPTPPTARIDTPQHGDCPCDSVTVTGIACDEDGEYDYDKLEYRRVNAAPGTPWTLIGTYSSPVCNPGNLYTWNLDDIDHGWYFLRLTVVNECGLSSTDIVSILVSKEFGTINIESPAPNDVVCGTVTFEGTISHHCSGCFDRYYVWYGPPQGPFVPVDPDNPEYYEHVINGEVAVWDTVGLGVPDGDYVIRIIGLDVCQNFELRDIPVTVDNSAGCGCAADLNDDGQVNIFDLLQLLGTWGACP